MTTTGILAGVDGIKLQQAFIQAMVRDEVKHVTHDYAQGTILYGPASIHNVQVYMGHPEFIVHESAIGRHLINPSADDVAHRARSISEAACKLSKTADEMRIVQ